MAEPGVEAVVPLPASEQEAMKSAGSRASAVARGTGPSTGIHDVARGVADARIAAATTVMVSGRRSVVGRGPAAARSHSRQEISALGLHRTYVWSKVQSRR